MSKWYEYFSPMAYFNNQPDPSGKAMPYYDQIPGEAGQYLNPYMQQGQQAGGQLMDQYSQMSQDPTSLINALMDSHQQSSGFNFQKDMMQSGLDANAAAGGYAGTDYDKFKQAQMMQGLASQDQNQWLSNVLGMQGQGLQGLQGFQNQGYGASGEMADIGTQALASKAGAAYQGQAQKNQSKNEMLKALIGAAGTAAGKAW